MALTGANVAFGKAIAAEVSVYVFVLFRFALASAALALLVGREPGPKLTEMAYTQWRDLILMALFGLVGFIVLMFEGLRRTAAADAGIITAALPAVVAVLGVALVGDRLSQLQLVAVGLAVAGLLLVQATGVHGGVTTLLGNLLVVAAVLCEASFVVLGKRLAPPYRPLRLSLGANLAGLVLSLPLAVAALPGFDIAACPTWRPGWPDLPRPPSPSLHSPPRPCIWARRSTAGGSPAPRW
jgi:drug/metabolite transporter (DMT)-like permease